MSKPSPSRSVPLPYRHPLGAWLALAAVADARVLPVLQSDAIRLAFSYWPGVVF
jgi:hypothetical protein